MDKLSKIGKTQKVGCQSKFWPSDLMWNDIMFILIYIDKNIQTLSNLFPIQEHASLG